ncbi:MAG TPA: metallophosphoesterase [Cyclobacteriaceae bacterium]
MKLDSKIVFKQLDKLYDHSEKIKIKDNDKIVIFSDLHMGDGGTTDDFKRNSKLFTKTLQEYYLPRGFKLVLNGDIEELQKFSLTRISKNWNGVYKIFDQFAADQKLLKTFGNHDLLLSVKKDIPMQYPLKEGYKLSYNDNNIFVFHGHQASKKYQKHNQLVGFTLKYFANPLGIKNYSVSHSSTKQFKIEKKVYTYSNVNKIASVIGHTHRPLFESLHKVDRLKYKIEQLCRDYSANHKDTSKIRESINSYKKELMKFYNQHKDFTYQNNLYNTIFHIPSVFNSGTVIGKRGITCLEIDNHYISLIHWFDKKISKKYLKNTGYDPEPLKNTDYYRMTINCEHLDYIFTRIRLLS